jgi:hypothetical protein
VPAREQSCRALYSALVQRNARRLQPAHAFAIELYAVLLHPYWQVREAVGIHVRYRIAMVHLIGAKGAGAEVHGAGEGFELEELGAIRDVVARGIVIPPVNGVEIDEVGVEFLLVKEPAENKCMACFRLRALARGRATSRPLSIRPARKESVVLTMVISRPNMA